MATEHSQEALDKALSKTKISLLRYPDSAFFATLVFNLKHEFSEAIPTACTNGKTIRYNPDFFMKLDRKERLGLILHEIMHVAMLHMVRLKSHDPVRWNVATDLWINPQLLDRGFTLPKGALVDRQYDGLSSEEIYDKLPDPDPEEVETHFELGDGGGSDALTEEQTEELEAEIQDILVQAQIQSRMAGDKAGTIPGEIELYIDQLLKPKLPTATLLRRYLNSFNKDDYSWKRPNRRFMPDHYLPSLHSEALGHIAVAVDASASVSDDEFHRFVSEVGGILRQMRPKRISLVTFDSQVRSVDEVHNLRELVQVSFTGRGGTSIEPVLEWVEAHTPQVTLVFTDGYFHYPPNHRTRQALIWLVHSNPRFKAPHGKTFHYQLKD